MGELKVTAGTDESGVRVVALSGEADVTSSGLLVDTLVRMLPFGATGLIVDTAKLSFCDTAALAALVMAARAIRANGGWLTLRRPGRQLLDLIRMTGLHTMLRVEAPAPA